MSADSALPSHLTTEELAAYLDRHLDRAATSRLERHMANCRECRAELVEMRALLASADSAVSATRIKSFASARHWLAAAAILVIALVPLLRAGPRSGASLALPVRSSLSPGTIEVLAPRERSLPEPGVVLAWRAIEGASTYRLTIADSSGAPLVTRMMTDTTVTATTGVEVRRGHAYLWYVDCLTRDGRTVSSGIQSFSMSR